MDHHKKTLFRVCLRSWKGLLRIVEILAMRRKNNLQAAPRPFCNAAFHLLLWEYWKDRGKRFRQFKERWENFWYYVPLAFQMWLFLRYALRPTTSAHEAHNEMTTLKIRKQWCFWVVENHQKQKRRVKLLYMFPCEQLNCCNVVGWLGTPGHQGTVGRKLHLSSSRAGKCSRNVPLTPHTTKWCFWVVDNH